MAQNDNKNKIDSNSIPPPKYTTEEARRTYKELLAITEDHIIAKDFGDQAEERVLKKIELENNPPPREETLGEKVDKATNTLFQSTKTSLMPTYSIKDTEVAASVSDIYTATTTAGLFTLLLMVIIIKFCWNKYKKNKENKEKNKLKIFLYYLSRIDKKREQKHSIIVILLANLSSERISIKDIEYSGKSKNGAKITGSPGWFEQPDELSEIRNRILPVLLEPGQTVDLPLLKIAIFKDIKDLKIKLIDFDDKEYLIEQFEIDKICGNI